jgi:ubiquinone biosynthesis UbiH/UbiF/VisC/COQ6 family hydroxylase
MDRYDIVISGAGMVGSILANAAIQKGFKVLLIESNILPHIDEGSDRELRVSAISSQNIEYLTKLGIFKHLINSRIHNYQYMQVWDTRSQASIDFETDFSRHSNLGYMIENNNLIQASIANLKKHESFKLIQNNKIQNLENYGSQLRVELVDGQTIKSKLLIAAEGRKSKVRDLVEIKTTEINYHQWGLVAYVQIQKAPSHTALQAFNQGGPIGLLPFGGGLFSIVWSLEDKHKDEWLSCDSEVFENGLKTAISRDYGEIKLISNRAAFPLTQLYAKQYYKNRIVLCGDTAHGIHPLAGQGVNLGIGDIQELFNNLDLEIIKDDDLLNLNLRKYQRRRISKVIETSEMMSFINDLFKDDSHIKKPLRKLAFNLLNKTRLKNWFASQAGS